MDLRRRLIGSLSLLLGSLLAIIAVIQLVSLRSDIDAEIEASTRLVNVLLAATDPPSAAAPGPSLAQRLAAGGLRHLSIRTPEQPPPVYQPHPLLARLGLFAARARRTGDPHRRPDAVHRPQAAFRNR